MTDSSSYTGDSNVKYCVLFGNGSGSYDDDYSIKHGDIFWFGHQKKKNLFMLK